MTPQRDHATTHQATFSVEGTASRQSPLPTSKGQCDDCYDGNQQGNRHDFKGQRQDANLD